VVKAYAHICDHHNIYYSSALTEDESLLSSTDMYHLKNPNEDCTIPSFKVTDSGLHAIPIC